MRRNNKQMTSYFILFSILLIGVVYAILQANLQINGVANIKANTWDIHFDNIQVNENSVPIGTGDSAATIDPENNCKVDFEVTLSLPGDFYEFTIDVVNSGTIDGMIGELNKTLIVNGTPVDTPPYYLDYSVTYADGMEVLKNHIITAGYTKKFKVRLEFKTDIEELPQASTISTSLTPQYIQADSSSVYYREVDFANDSWDEIINAYKVGNINALEKAMKAGTTRNVTVQGFGSHKLRIANLSKPDECNTTGFSQTACGFVIEFANQITTHIMNPFSYNNENVIGVGTKGGWEYSDMRAYLNSGKYLEDQSEETDYTSDGLFNILPVEIRNIIINTYVVSGYSRYDSANFTTIDRLYLLSPHEVWEDVDEDTSNGIDYYDKSYSNTRQLDYYANLNVTTSNYSAAKKSDMVSGWWLRSAYYNSSSDFYSVNNMNNGNPKTKMSQNWIGISPAFRIAE